MNDQPHPVRRASARDQTGLVWWLALSVLLCGSSAHAADVQVDREAFVMGTRIRVEVRAASRARGLEASEVALRTLQRTADRLSTWRDDSELARLNRAPVGKRVHLSSELFSTLTRAQVCSQHTHGAFDPAVGPLVAAWGLRTGGHVPSDAERRRAARLSGIGAFQLNADGTATRMWRGASLEEGGFGKGVALDAALAVVAAEPGVRDALIDLGGQIGVRSAGDAWSIELAHPEFRERPIATLQLSVGSIATSGNSEHGIEVDGIHYSHLLDPRSGRPAPDFGSLVVLAPTGLKADCLSTGLYVLGPDAALQWALRHPEIEVAVLESTDAGVRIRATPGLADRIRPLSADVELKRVGDDTGSFDSRRASTQSADNPATVRVP